MLVGLVIDQSASSRIICVEVSSGKESFFKIERGIKLILAPRSARAKHASNSRKSHGMRNLPGSPNFLGNFFKITAEQFSFTGVVAKSINFSLLLRRILNIKANLGIYKRASAKLSSKYRYGRFRIWNNNGLINWNLSLCHRRLDVFDTRLYRILCHLGHLKRRNSRKRSRSKRRLDN
nr:hypothetical protein [Tanacetum cinerariifolium]